MNGWYVDNGLLVSPEGRVMAQQTETVAVLHDLAKVLNEREDRSEQEQALAQAIRNSWGQGNPKDDHLRFVVEVEGFGAMPYSSQHLANLICLGLNDCGYDVLGHRLTFRVDETSQAALRIYEAGLPDKVPSTATMRANPAP